jgi:hypothetical protein
VSYLLLNCLTCILTFGDQISVVYHSISSSVCIVVGIGIYWSFQARVVKSYLRKSINADSGQIFSQLNIKERNPSRFNILTYQMIGDIDIFGSITYSIIGSDVDGGLIVANNSSISNRHIKSLDGVR